MKFSKISSTLLFILFFALVGCQKKGFQGTYNPDGPPELIPTAERYEVSIEGFQGTYNPDGPPELIPTAEPDEVSIGCDVNQLITEIETSGTNGKIIYLDDCSYIFNVSNNSVNDSNNQSLGGNAIPSIDVPVTLNGNDNTVFQRNPHSSTQQFRFLFVDPTGKLIVNNIHFANGDISNLENAGGGAIFNNGGSVWINNASFEENKAYKGGALINRSGFMQIYNSEFSNNSANDGGAIANESEGESNVSNSNFQNNYSNDFGGAILNSSGNVQVLSNNFYFNSAGGRGGAFYSEGNNSSVDMQECIFSDNEVGESDRVGLGGAAAFKGGENFIENCQFSGNTAINGRGGAIWIIQSDSTNIINNKIYDNFAVYGGGIYSTSHTSINNSEIYSNEALWYGGGIFSESGVLQIFKTAIYDNSSHDSGGGISSWGGIVRLTNSTISGNQSNDASAISGSFIMNNCTIAYNSVNRTRGRGIIGSGQIKNTIIIENRAPNGNLRTCGFTSPVQLTGINLSDDSNYCTGFTITSNADLSPLANNGGSSMTHAISQNSDALNIVDDCTTVNGQPITTDQRDIARPQGTGCDCGAFELEETGIPVPLFPYIVILRTLDCHLEPSSSSTAITSFQTDDIVEVVGRNINLTWYQVAPDELEDPCWVWEGGVEFVGDLESVEIIPSEVPVEEEKPEEEGEEKKPEEEGEEPSPIQPGPRF